MIWTASPKFERVVIEFWTTTGDAGERVVFWVACVRTIRPARSSHTDRTNGAIRNCWWYGWFFEFVSATVLVEPGIGTRYRVAGRPSTSPVPTAATGPVVVVRAVV